MALQLIQPETLTQSLPGLAQVALNSDDTILRAVGVQLGAWAQEALTLTAADAAVLATGMT